MSESHVVIPIELYNQLIAGIPERDGCELQVLLDEESYSSFVMRNADHVNMEALQEISRLPTYRLEQEGAHGD